MLIQRWRRRAAGGVEEHEDLSRTGLLRFNQLLWNYPGWYNQKRPHHSLGLRPPLTALNDACLPESQNVVGVIHLQNIVDLRSTLSCIGTH